MCPAALLHHRKQTLLTANHNMPANPHLRLSFQLSHLCRLCLTVSSPLCITQVSWQLDLLLTLSMLPPTLCIPIPPVLCISSLQQLAQNLIIVVLQDSGCICMCQTEFR